ncbi:2OG-Fe(II) oxygenase [Mastigocoleus testarum]|uniref:Uncharacterized protein n=1 Tax=Mastigocoleus testarum BC008 TaxID=371196 RepID=A0A0V8A0Q3_9CYAN|nr:2OG-Fe(II) oxygenase [Mastigocoleus testarum]KST70365.1 hypothetical protein BC008_45025 [Mastigocoleus testarum BC008]
MATITSDFFTLNKDSLKNYPDAINQIYRGNIDGICIKNVFSKEDMLKVKHNLENKKDYLKDYTYTQGYGKFIGAILQANTDDKTAYFKDAAALRVRLKNIFEHRDYETTIQAVFSQISGGREVQAAQESSNKVYSPAITRYTSPSQGGIKVHKGNEFIDHPAFDGLKQVAKVRNSLSYFIVVDKPEDGGELVLYDGLPDKLTVPKQDLDLDNCQKRSFQPDAGDMTIFHGATIWHAISDVKGKKNRISIGGFVGLSADERKVVYWS